MPDLSARLDAIAADAARVVFEGNPPDADVLGPLIDAEPIACLVADDAGRYVAANRAASDLTGYSNAEIRRLSVWDFTPGPAERDAEVLWRAFQQQGKQIGNYELITKSGRAVNAAYAARANVLPGLHLSLLLPVTPDRHSFEQ